MQANIPAGSRGIPIDRIFVQRGNLWSFPSMFVLRTKTLYQSIQEFLQQRVDKLLKRTRMDAVLKRVNTVDEVRIRCQPDFES